MTERELNDYSPLTLAFLGDAVYEQLVREKIVRQANMPVHKLHERAVELVRAEYQASAIKRLTEQGSLTEKEQDIFRRGRNACGVTVPKHSTVAEYRAATGLECLFGYLFLAEEHQRIRELFALITENNEQKD